MNTIFWGLSTADPFLFKRLKGIKQHGGKKFQHVSPLVHKTINSATHPVTIITKTTKHHWNKEWSGLNPPQRLAFNLEFQIKTNNQLSLLGLVPL